MKQFPLVFAAIADGELHLTGLLMIGPHLTPENHVDVLRRAKFRTKKELGRLVRELCPLPKKTSDERSSPSGGLRRATKRSAVSASEPANSGRGGPVSYVATQPSWAANPAYPHLPGERRGWALRLRR